VLVALTGSGRSRFAAVSPMIPAGNAAAISTSHRQQFEEDLGVFLLVVPVSVKIAEIC